MITATKYTCFVEMKHCQIKIIGFIGKYNQQNQGSCKCLVCPSVIANMKEQMNSIALISIARI